MTEHITSGAGTVVAVGMALIPGVLWWALPLTPTGTRG